MIVGLMMLRLRLLLLRLLMRMMLLLLLLLLDALLGRHCVHALLLLLLLLGGRGGNGGSLHGRVMMLRRLMMMRKTEAEAARAGRASRQRGAVDYRAERSVRRHPRVMGHRRYTLVRMRWHLGMQAAALHVRLHRVHLFLPVPVQLADLFWYRSTSRKSTEHAENVNRSTRRNRITFTTAAVTTLTPVPARR